MFSIQCTIETKKNAKHNITVESMSTQKSVAVDKWFQKERNFDDVEL